MAYRHTALRPAARLALAYGVTAAIQWYWFLQSDRTATASTEVNAPVLGLN